jgi:hypothetical protein
MSNPHYPAMVDRRDVLKGAAALVVGATLTAVREVADMLGPDHRERDWRRRFAENSWILGSDFV